MYYVLLCALRSGFYDARFYVKLRLSRNPAEPRYIKLRLHLGPFFSSFNRELLIKITNCKILAKPSKGIHFITAIFQH